jgi:hypothetical protein
MSDDPIEGPAPEPPPGPPAGPPLGPTAESDQGPSAGQVLAGVFLILFGVCITLAGGSCTVLWIVIVFGEGSSGGGFSDGGFLFLLSLATLAAGLVTLWAGVKLLRGK